MQSNGDYLELVMNDRTGNLVYALSAGKAPRSGYVRASTAPLDTPAQAARQAVESVRSLRMIPPGSEIALAGCPISAGRDKIWRLTWRVRPDRESAAYNVKVALYQKDGRLHYASSKRETGL